MIETLKTRTEVRQDVRWLTPADWSRALLDTSNTLGFRGGHVADERHFHNPPKYRPWHHLLLVEKGSLVAQVDGRHISCPTGSLLWTPPGVHRSFHQEEGHAGLNTFRLHVSLRVGAQVLACEQGTLLAEGLWDLHGLFRLLMNDPAPETRDELWLRQVLAAITATVLYRQETDQGQERLNWGQRTKLDRHLFQHAHQGVYPSDLAKILDLSMPRFRRLCQATYGRSPRSQIRHWRLHQAAALLQETEEPIQTIAERVGISDPSLFRRQFRSTFGCTPSRFRRV